MHGRLLYGHWSTQPDDAHPIASQRRMSMDLNRQQKRAMRRMGVVNEQGAPVRQPVATGQAREDRKSVV